MKLLHKSPTTKVFLDNNKIIKHFLGEDAEYRFEHELEFYRTHQCENLLKLFKFDSKKLNLELEYARGEFPGFLDKLEAKNLSKDDLQRIRNAITNIQKLNKKIIVHNDLAPHNIYLTENRVIIADWDSWFLTDNERFREYDFKDFTKSL